MIINGKHLLCKILEQKYTYFHSLFLSFCLAFRLSLSFSCAHAHFHTQAHGHIYVYEQTVIYTEISKYSNTYLLVFLYCVFICWLWKFSQQSPWQIYLKLMESLTNYLICIDYHRFTYIFKRKSGLIGLLVLMVRLVSMVRVAVMVAVALAAIVSMTVFVVVQAVKNSLLFQSLEMFKCICRKYLSQ